MPDTGGGAEPPTATGLLARLGASIPVVAAPMAGGPTTPALVVAAAQAGGLGLLAGGYLTPEELAERVAQVRAAGAPFGVNLFAPNPLPVDPAAFAAYAEALGVEAAEPREDDDAWAAKLDLLVADPVPVVSFTFGIPDRSVVRRLQGVGSAVVQTVTTPAEARQAGDAGVDGLVVQGCLAGGHSATTTPMAAVADVPLPLLVRQVRDAGPLPVWAAGGIATSAQVREVLAAGAEAAVVGTVLLRTPEAGTSSAHRAALADPTRTETLLTCAFTGRPARSLANGFTDRFSASAPLGYPAVHHLTAPLRRAAGEAGDPDGTSLWAGAGCRLTTEEPAAVVLARLAGSPSPLVVSAVAILREGAVLTVRKRGTSRFMLVGGKPEPGESPAECGIRETREEVGVEVRSVRLLGEYVAAAANEPGHLVRSTVFVADPVAAAAEPAVAGEIDELRWVDLERAAAGAYDDLAPLLVSLLPVLTEAAASAGQSG